VPIDRDSRHIHKALHNLDLVALETCGVDLQSILDEFSR
jgi:hypothetical protein